MATEKHIELADFIKNVHQTLRLQSRMLGADEAWQQHCAKTQILKKYAENMQQLATTFWAKKSNEASDTCRIQWVVKECINYFHNGGHAEAEAKEEKMSKRYFDKPVLSELLNIGLVESTVFKLLDVGSCFNPFSKFPLFDVTALDLIPATSDVLKCDFLSVNIISNSEKIENPCFSLPEMYFDIVVFSLLLEYFPSSKQRFVCCKKAYELLKPNGVLFILTPDSKHATANSKVMKSWRVALASLGFWRISYQKLKHLHCMCYRKCVDQEVPRHWYKLQQCSLVPEDMVCIPQDFHEYCDNTSIQPTVVQRCEVENELLADTFSHLPGDSNIFS